MKQQENPQNNDIQLESFSNAMMKTPYHDYSLYHTNNKNLNKDVLVCDSDLAKSPLSIAWVTDIENIERKKPDVKLHSDQDITMSPKVAADVTSFPVCCICKDYSHFTVILMICLTKCDAFFLDHLQHREMAKYYQVASISIEQNRRLQVEHAATAYRWKDRQGFEGGSLSANRCRR